MSLSSDKYQLFDGRQSVGCTYCRILTNRALPAFQLVATNVGGRVSICNITPGVWNGGMVFVGCVSTGA